MGINNRKKKEVFGIMFCPHCKGDFVYERMNGLSSGILRCSCYEYPILDDVIFLIKREDILHTVNLIKQGKIFDAWTLQVEVGFSYTHRIINRIKKYNWNFGSSLMMWLVIFLKRNRARKLRSLLPKGNLKNIFDFLSTKKWGSYVMKREKSASFIIGKTILKENMPNITKNKTIAEKFIVFDHMSGPGIYAKYIQEEIPNATVIAADQSFLNALLGKYFFSNKVVYVCFDANDAIPIKNNMLDLFINSDGFHYLKNKKNQEYCKNEIQRIMMSNSKIIFLHLHVKSGKNKGEGIARSKEEYKSLFNDFYPTIIDEQSEINKKYKHIESEGCSLSLIGEKIGENFTS